MAARPARRARSSSIRAEPYVAVVDANVDRKGTRAAAEAYLQFLYTSQAQETIARHFYRPIDETVGQRHAAELPAIPLFAIARVARDWEEAQQKFFAEGGIFDQIYQPGK
jgi:sulfate transport system substrate-binding protein